MLQDILNCYRTVDPHVSVDCVLIGYDGNQLCTLLVKQQGAVDDGNYSYMKLPGSLIFIDEDLDEAARRVLMELTGLKSVPLLQFKAFGDKDRVKNPRDQKWLRRFHSLNQTAERIVSIGYLSLLRIDRKYEQLTDLYEAKWCPIKEVGNLAFDHNQMLTEALKYIRQYVELNPSALFDLLPRKFTAAQLRTLFDLVYDKVFDIRNFHKRISQMPYVVPLDEKEVGVAHRAARYYKFDKTIYNKTHR